MKNLINLLLFGLIFSSEVVNGNECDGAEPGSYLNDPRTCSGYIFCFDGVANFGDCDNDLHFDVKTQTCIPPAESRCFDCPTNDITFHPRPGSCTEFIICVGGIPFDRTCSDGTQFNEALGSCDREENVNCYVNPCPDENDPHNIVYIPSDEDCEVYYMCLDGAPQERRCASGIHFNPDTNRCDKPGNVNCTLNDITTTTTTTEETTTTTTTEETTTTPEITTTPIAPEPPVWDECPTNTDGLYFVPTKNGCDNYIACFGGSFAIVLTCAPGLHFDPISRKCDDVNC